MSKIICANCGEEKESKSMVWGKITSSPMCYCADCTVEMSPPKTKSAPIETDLPNWLCHPDEDRFHFTMYSPSVGGCQIHQIAGGSTLPKDALEALIHKEVLKARKQEEIETIEWVLVQLSFTDPEADEKYLNDRLKALQTKETN